MGQAPGLVQIGFPFSSSFVDIQPRQQPRYHQNYHNNPHHDHHRHHGTTDIGMVIVIIATITITITSSNNRIVVIISVIDTIAKSVKSNTVSNVLKKSACF